MWVFFWAVSVKFGQASGAQSILDQAAAPLGIMAVAVALLMIGGEFDLSSGAATGALGILTILLVRDVAGEAAGAGFSLWVALPISLLAALGLGWWNGFLVNRTSLPSFIVTLGSFFVLKGAKLGFSKLIVDQIQVGKLDDLAIYAEENGVSDKGYGLLDKVFAGEWIRNEHVWDSRDWVYSIGTLAGLTLVVLAVYEFHFRQGCDEPDRPHRCRRRYRPRPRRRLAAPQHRWRRREHHRCCPHRRGNARRLHRLGRVALRPAHAERRDSRSPRRGDGTAHRRPHLLRRCHPRRHLDGCAER